MSDTTPEEPTLADVLTSIGNLSTQIRELRVTTVQAHADLRRDIQRRLEALQRGLHLEIRALDGRVAVVEGAMQEIRDGLQEVRELSQELLTYAHRPDDV